MKYLFDAWIVDIHLRKSHQSIIIFPFEWMFQTFEGNNNWNWIVVDHFGESYKLGMVSFFSQNKKKRVVKSLETQLNKNVSLLRKFFSVKLLYSYFYNPSYTTGNRFLQNFCIRFFRIFFRVCLERSFNFLPNYFICC